MAIIRRNNITDPLTLLSRNFFGWEPFESVGRSIAKAEPPAFDLRFEVKETDDGFLFSADLPGVKKEDIDVTLDGNRLTVTGSRRAEETSEGEKFHIYELSYGSFSRTFTLPSDTAGDEIVADLKDGVLKLTVPKKVVAKPKKIELK